MKEKSRHVKPKHIGLCALESSVQNHVLNGLDEIRSVDETGNKPPNIPKN